VIESTGREDLAEVTHIARRAPRIAPWPFIAGVLMPIAALVMSVVLLNRGWIPFDLFDRDSGAEADSPSDLPTPAGGTASERSPSPTSAVTETSDPLGEGDVRKFRVAVAPPDFDEDERRGAVAIPAFHTYLLEELKSIPQIAIVELPAATQDLTPEDADFYLETGGERYPSDPPTWTFQVRWTATRGGDATWSRIHESLEAELLKATARDAAASLRRYPFPPADSRGVELQSVALDSERERLERFDAMLELHDIPKRFELVGRDERRMAAAAGAAIVLNSSDPEIRARAWQAMEGVEDTYLIGPLVDSLLLDPSDLVRVEATKLLAHEYSDDSRAQAALQNALLNDLSPRVRAHARWSSLDSEGRRQFLVASLGNPDLPDPERLVLITADVNDIRDFIDRRAVSSLIEIAIRARPSAEAAAGAAEPGTVVATEVVPILLEFLKDRTVNESVRASIASGLSRHLAEPGVRETFEELAKQNTSYWLRSEVQAALRRAQPPQR